jgi:hypothetical protein
VSRIFSTFGWTEWRRLRAFGFDLGQSRDSRQSLCCIIASFRLKRATSQELAEPQHQGRSSNRISSDDEAGKHLKVHKRNIAVRAEVQNAMDIAEREIVRLESKIQIPVPEPDDQRGILERDAVQRLVSTMEPKRARNGWASNSQAATRSPSRHISR